MKHQLRFNLRYITQGYKSKLGLLICLILCLTFGSAQETADEPSTNLEEVQAIIEQAMMTDNQLVKLLGAQIKEAAEAQQQIDGLTLSLAAKSQEVADLQAEAESLQAQYATLSTEVDASKQESAALQAQIDESASELQVVIQERDIIQSAFARVQDASDKGKIRIAELEELLATNTTTIEGLETKVATLEAQYQAALIGAETVREEALKLPDLQDRLATVNAESAKLQSHIQRVTNSRDRLKVQHERTLLEIDSFEQAMTDALFRANALEAQLRSVDTSASTQLQNLRRQYADAQSQIFSLEGSLEGARSEVDRLQAIIDGGDSGALSEDLQAKDEEISSLKDQVATLRTTIINLPNSDKLLTLQEERDSLQTELESLQAQLDNLRNSTSTIATTVAENTSSDGSVDSAGVSVNATVLAAALPASSEGTSEGTSENAEVEAGLPELAAPTAASELPTDLDQAKDYATLKLNEYYLFRDRVTDLGANVTLLELNQREEALINLQEAQTNVANLSGAQIYTVQPGDSLSAISSELYGSSVRWEEILTTNNYIIDDPDVIFPGFQLIIPQ